jgi:hypothetical protein
VSREVAGDDPVEFKVAGDDPVDPTVERKVAAASTGAAVAGFVIWALNAYVFHGDVPTAVQAVVLILVPGLVALVSGYIAKHTPR